MKLYLYAASWAVLDGRRQQVVTASSEEIARAAILSMNPEAKFLKIKYIGEA